MNTEQARMLAYQLLLKQMNVYGIAQYYEFTKLDSGDQDDVIMAALEIEECWWAEYRRCLGWKDG